jgi:hypothetical protein
MKALYYPHTEIQDPRIIKNALLLWDELETIVPRRHWQRASRNSRDLDEAIELIVRERVPSSAEKAAAHKALEAHVDSGLVASIARAQTGPWRHRPYAMYPDKFLHRTWELLTQGGHAQWLHEMSDYGVPPAVGLLMMSLLANECAGDTVRKVTDRAESYEWLARETARIAGAPYAPGLPATAISPSHDRLVTLSVSVIDAAGVPLKRLVELRKRELKSGDTVVRDLRLRYLRSLDDHLKKIGEAKKMADVRELERQFRAETQADFKELKRELRSVAGDLVLSKDVYVAVLVVAGSALAVAKRLMGGTTTLGGIGAMPLLKAWKEYRGKREKALKAHSTSWLYVSTRGRLPLF